MATKPTDDEVNTLSLLLDAYGMAPVLRALADAEVISKKRHAQWEAAIRRSEAD